MLFPIVLKVDGYIQAESKEQAECFMKSAVVDDLLLLDPDDNRIPLEQIQIGNWNVFQPSE